MTKQGCDAVDDEAQVTFLVWRKCLQKSVDAILKNFSFYIIFLFTNVQRKININIIIYYNTYICYCQVVNY